MNQNRTASIVFAASLLLMATVAGPLSAIVRACAMPCCEGMATPMSASVAAGSCAEHCGMRDPAGERHAIPDAVAASSAKISFNALAVSDPIGSPETRSLSQRFPARTLPLHAVPGDPPLYLYNSLFLI